jgi:hypothetical protein
MTTGHELVAAVPAADFERFKKRRARYCWFRAGVPLWIDYAAQDGLTRRPETFTAKALVCLDARGSASLCRACRAVPR